MTNLARSSRKSSTGYAFAAARPASIRIPTASSLGVARLSSAQNTPGWTGSVWSIFRRFGKSFEELISMREQVTSATPVERLSEAGHLDPIQLELPTAPSELEHNSYAWIYTETDTCVLHIFEKGNLTVTRQSEDGLWRALWRPNKRTQAREGITVHIPDSTAICFAPTLSGALAGANEWAEQTFPKQMIHHSRDSPWFLRPSTQRNTDFLYVLLGYDGPTRPNVILVDGQSILISDLSRGQVSALIEVAKIHDRKREDNAWKRVYSKEA